MGMFGKSAYGRDPGMSFDRPQHSVGAQLLNLLGRNLLGVDYLRQQDQRAALQRLQETNQQAAGLFQPIPGEMQQASVQNSDGADITDAFGPQMEQGPSRMRTPAEIAAGLAAYSTVPGFDPTKFKDLAAYAKPEVHYDRGFGYNQATGEPMGGFHPQLGEGQMIGPNGVQNLPGYVQSAAETAGATTRAQEGGKAAFDVITLNQPDGSTVQVPRDVAVQALLQSMVGGGGGGLGRSQTPGAKVAQEGDARTGVERRASQPQQFSGLQDQARTTDLVIDTINKALPMINGGTAGFMANLAPIKGLPPHDLQATLDTIRGNVGFEQLSKMRANSPTGGALGSVSEQENRMLQSVLGSLDAGQSPAQLRQSLTQVRDQLVKLRQQRQQLYNNTYGDQAAPARAAPTMTGRRGSRIISVQ